MRVPEHDDVALLTQHVVDADVLRVEAVVRLVDVVGVRRRGAEDDSHVVVGEMSLERAAGCGGRDEVERAAEPDTLCEVKHARVFSWE